jgi:hypothetical protein
MAGTKRCLGQCEVNEIALGETAAATVRKMSNMIETLDATREVLAAERDQGFADRSRQWLVGG